MLHCCVVSVQEPWLISQVMWWNNLTLAQDLNLSIGCLLMLETPQRIWLLAKQIEPWLERLGGFPPSEMPQSLSLQRGKSFKAFVCKALPPWRNALLQNTYSNFMEAKVYQSRLATPPTGFVLILSSVLNFTRSKSRGKVNFIHFQNDTWKSSSRKTTSAPPQHCCSRYSEGISHKSHKALLSPVFRFF